ncbi:GD19747 [Drosophila simulans]|uniref:GD19747 n=1 Tax=Drosophila simulans TaxID=7240 RepID=B4NVG2_DROSI|nr:GD19747 [Drosophila simulans]
MYIIYKFFFASKGGCRQRLQESFQPEDSCGSVVPGQQGTSVHLNIRTSCTSIKIYNLNCSSNSNSLSPTTSGAEGRSCQAAFHSTNLNCNHSCPSEDQYRSRNHQHHHHHQHRISSDIISSSLRQSHSHSLSLCSVQSNPMATTRIPLAAEDNNCSLRLSSCQPLKFPLASEWLV